MASEQSMLFPESLAERFIAAREVRGWSRGRVAEKLRLPEHVVQWIETEQYDRIGERVYLRGYLTNYARLVGIPIDAVAAELRVKAPPPPTLVATGQIPRSRYLIERYSGSALYLVLTGVIFVPLVMFAMNMGGGIDTRLTPLDAPAPAVAVAVDSDSTTNLPAASATAGATSLGPAMAATTASSDSPLMASFAMMPSVPATEAAKPPAPATSLGLLRLSLAEASWVEIVDADGKRLEYSTLPAGTTKEYPTDKALTILLGNTNGAKVDVAGQAQDIAPYNRGNVARFKLAAGAKSIATASVETHNG